MHHTHHRPNSLHARAPPVWSRDVTVIQTFPWLHLSVCSSRLITAVHTQRPGVLLNIMPVKNKYVQQHKLSTARGKEKSQAHADRSPEGRPNLACWGPTCLAAPRQLQQKPHTPHGLLASNTKISPFLEVIGHAPTHQVL